MLLLLVTTTAAGCTGVIQYPAPATSGKGQAIDGWMEYRLGSSYEEIKQTLNAHGFTITPISQVNAMQVATAFLTFLDTTPASSEALMLPDDMIVDGRRSVLVFGYEVGGRVPREAVVLRLDFNRDNNLLMAVVLLFRPMHGFDLGNYATNVIVPRLDDRYRRATGWASGREEKIIGLWVDPGSEHVIMLFGINKPSPKGILALMYSAVGVSKGLDGPLF